MNIAVMGTKGLPAKWGGIEKYVEETGRRLVERGHRVTVFGSRWYCQSGGARRHMGMKIVPVPSLKYPATDALSNSISAAGIAGFGPYDIVHFHGMSSLFFVPFLNFMGKKSVVTAHGVESGWDNPKYGGVGVRVLKAAFKTGMRHAHCVTSVAGHVSDTIRENYRVESHFTPGGMEEATSLSPGLIKEKYGLTESGYLLFLGRLDPVKRVHWIPELADILPAGMKIVIAGGSQDAKTLRYEEELAGAARRRGRIIMTGPVSGREKAELLSNCRFLLSPSENEGLPLTLLEAGAYGKFSVASDIPAHREVIRDGHNGFLFRAERKESFIQAVASALAETGSSLDRIGAAARAGMKSTFDWEKTADQLEILFRRLINEK